MVYTGKLRQEAQEFEGSLSYSKTLAQKVSSTKDVREVNEVMRVALNQPLWGYSGKMMSISQEEGPQEQPFLQQLWSSACSTHVCGRPQFYTQGTHCGAIIKGGGANRPTYKIELECL